MDKFATPSMEALRQYLYQEARLLDEKRWDEWSALFVEDGKYWVPASRNQPDPLNHVSGIIEGGSTRGRAIRAVVWSARRGDVWRCGDRPGSPVIHLDQRTESRKSRART